MLGGISPLLPSPTEVRVGYRNGGLSAIALPCLLLISRLVPNQSLYTSLSHRYATTHTTRDDITAFVHTSKKNTFCRPHKEIKATAPHVRVVHGHVETPEDTTQLSFPLKKVRFRALGCELHSAHAKVPHPLSA